MNMARLNNIKVINGDHYESSKNSVHDHFKFITQITI